MSIHVDYYQLISLENLFQAWSEFGKGKSKKIDVQIFERYLEDNLFHLWKSLQSKTYRHGDYESFFVNDPKRRHIHKAEVEDRIVHHLLYKFLYELFDKNFIYDSYSCRLNKGTHKGVERLEVFARKVSRNYKGSCWALKCDIKKFFASVDHEVLLRLLKRKIQDEDIICLIKQVIDSFCSCQRDSGQARMTGECMSEARRGIPLGNLTSQVFANIYLNELDQFAKHKLKIKYYLRYADDFILLSGYKDTLKQSIMPISFFLKDNLKLNLHKDKIIFRKLEWGIDFLGYIVLPYYILPRTKTRKRIFKKLKENINSTSFEQSFQSYLGHLKHANSFKLTQKLKNQVWLLKLP